MSVGQTGRVQARSALFDVFGDHLRDHDGRAPVAALVRLLGPLGIAAPAVRTAVSRMVRQGWLDPVRLPSGPGYALTPRAERRLEDAYARIYRTAEQGWDGRWHVVVLGPPSGRAARERLSTGLGFLGYAPLRTGTWVSPRASAELGALLAAEGCEAETFHASYDGSPAELAGRAWDLTAIADAYARFEAAAPELAGGEVGDPADAFARRSRLVHEWRKLLFVDPGLPPEVLPADWAGSRAARTFDEQSRRLLPAARDFVADCLQHHQADRPADRPADRASDFPTDRPPPRQRTTQETRA